MNLQEKITRYQEQYHNLRERRQALLEELQKVENLSVFMSGRLAQLEELSEELQKTSAANDERVT